jgi:hypothetical protein
MEPRLSSLWHPSQINNLLRKKVLRPHPLFSPLFFAGARTTYGHHSKKNHYFRFTAETIDKACENFYLSPRIIMRQQVRWQGALQALASSAWVRI